VRWKKRRSEVEEEKGKIIKEGGSERERVMNQIWLG
jgi:hypothetical protein